MFTTLRDCPDRGFTLYLRWIKGLLEKGEGGEGGKNISWKGCLQNNFGLYGKDIKSFFERCYMFFRRMLYVFLKDVTSFSERLKSFWGHTEVHHRVTQSNTEEHFTGILFVQSC